MDKELSYNLLIKRILEIDLEDLFETEKYISKKSGKEKTRLVFNVKKYKKIMKEEEKLPIREQSNPIKEPVRLLYLYYMNKYNGVWSQTKTIEYIVKVLKEAILYKTIEKWALRYRWNRDLTVDRVYSKFCNNKSKGNSIGGKGNKEKKKVNGVYLTPEQAKEYKKACKADLIDIADVSSSITSLNLAELILKNNLNSLDDLRDEEDMIVTSKRVSSDDVSIMESFIESQHISSHTNSIIKELAHINKLKAEIKHKNSEAKCKRDALELERLKLELDTAKFEFLKQLKLNESGDEGEDPFSALANALASSREKVNQKKKEEEQD